MSFVVANRPFLGSPAPRRAWWIHQGYFYPFDLFNFGSRLITCSGLQAACLRLSPTHSFIEWDVDQADDASLEAALTVAQRVRSHCPVVLRFRKIAWAEERYPSPQAGRRRVERLRGLSAVDLPPITTIRRVELCAIEQADARLRQAMATWTGNRAIEDWPEASPLDAGFLLSRAGPGLVFSRIGHRSEIAQRCGLAWRQTAIGQPTHAAILDPRYNQRVDDGYWTAMRDREPVLEHVLAHVEECGRDAEWIPYQRLTLPTRDGVAVFTKITPAISIPFLSQTAA